MLLRAIALSLAFLLGFGTIVPLMTDQSEASAKHHKKRKKHRKIRKYSKAWWRIYRAKQKRRRALQARKRALEMRQQQMAAERTDNPELVLKNDAAGQPVNAVVKVARSRPAKVNKNSKPVVQEVQQPNVLPSGELAPMGWKKNGADQSNVQFKVADNDGVDLGTADLKVVSPAMGDDSSKSVGGVATTALRRTVIDKMFKEQGWVVNDYQKNVDGQNVYVVVAQAPGAGGVQSRVFYFMEADGKVYSLATSAPVDRSEKLAQDSEKVLNSLKRLSRPVQASAAAAMR
jgi:hypothetical protein